MKTAFVVIILSVRHNNNIDPNCCICARNFLHKSEGDILQQELISFFFPEQQEKFQEF